MASMRRYNAVLVLALAIALAALPLLHNHPLIPSGSDEPCFSAALTLPCALCATAIARVSIDVPQISAPLPTIDATTAPSLPDPGIDVVSSRPSRAPPAA